MRIISDLIWHDDDDNNNNNNNNNNIIIIIITIITVAPTLATDVTLCKLRRNCYTDSHDIRHF